MASGYGYAVWWSTYGATGVLRTSKEGGTAVVLVLVLYFEQEVLVRGRRRRRRSDVRGHDEDENFGDNYFIIFNRDLVREQGVYLRHFNGI